MNPTFLIGTLAVLDVACAAENRAPFAQDAAAKGPSARDGLSIPAADAQSPFAVSFRRDLFPMVKQGCALKDCHDSATVTNHVTNFSTAAMTHNRWVMGPGTDFCIEGPRVFESRIIVVPGEPEKSFLLDKLTSTRVRPCNDQHFPRMPPPPLPPWTLEQIELVTRWIREGAIDD